MMNKTVVAIAILLYNLVLIAGTTFVVVVTGWSMWTFLLTMCFIMNLKTESKSES